LGGAVSAVEPVVIDELGDVAAQRCEVAETVQAGDEEPGVDGAGDGRGDRHRGHDGDARDVVHVPGGEAAPGFAEQHDPVGRMIVVAYESAQRDVAGAPEHDQVHVNVAGRRGRRGRRGRGGRGSGVDDANVGLAARGVGEREAVGDGDLVVARVGDAEQGCRGRRVDGDELHRVMAGGVERQNRSDGAGSLAASGAVEDHVEGGHRGRLLSLRWVDAVCGLHNDWLRWWRCVRDAVEPRRQGPQRWRP
jgi:hypothetical protein